MSTTNETQQTPDPTHRKRGRSRFRSLAIIGAIVAAVAITAGFGYGRQAMRHGPPGMHPGMMRDRAEFMVDRALKKVDASEEQRAQIEAILEASFEEGMAMRGDHETMHVEIQSILTADTVDRSRLEALRAEKLEQAEKMSKLLTKTIGDVADVLTPEQRRELAEYAESRWH